MKNIIFGLSDYLIGKNIKKRSHYYRHQRLLDEPSDSILIDASMRSQTAWDLIHRISRFGCRRAEHIDDPAEKRLLKLWKNFPQDRKYFEMILQQLELARRFRGLSLREFIFSAEGRKWYKSRKRLKRAVYFELDRAYKPTRKEALNHEARVHQLLRSEPLLRYKDLSILGIANAQKILESFPELETLRRKKLELLKKVLIRGLKY